MRRVLPIRRLPEIEQKNHLPRVKILSMLASSSERP